MRPRHRFSSPPSKSPAVRVSPSAAGFSAACSAHWRSCEPSSAVRAWPARPRRGPSRTPSLRRRRPVPAPWSSRGALNRGATRANHDKNTLLLILEPRLQVDAVRPDVNIAPGREIALLPAFVFFGPPLLQPRDGRCRQAGRILAEQRRQRLPEVTGRDALQVKDRDQHLQTL